MQREELKNILTKIRNYEIRIRKAVNAQMRGSFDSVFKGTGLEFDDVRTYQYGDDVRWIDWHASAKGEDTYIKVFKEEKEQTVFFLMDVSESQKTGRKNQKKLDLAKEVCGVLAISAVKEESEVGLICFSDQKEKYIKPDKGMKKAYEVIFHLYKLKPQSARTDLNGFIHYALNLIKRKSIIFLISDFIDKDYFQALSSMAKRHDLIVIHLIDEMDYQLPRLGIVPALDLEKKQTRWVNLSSKIFQNQYRKKFAENQEKLMELCREYQANYLPVFTTEDFVGKLIKLFKVRNRVIKSKKI